MRVLLLILGCGALAACEPMESTRGPAGGWSSHSARPPVSAAAVARVVVSDSTDLGHETEALGIVDAHELQGHHDEALRELREEGAALGADAVIGVEFHHDEGKGQPSHLSGLAVRYRKLLRDEPYDVLETLDIPTSMERQEEAMDELRRRASLLHADLVIGISYEHGEGDGPVHLRGRAIRYRSGGAPGGAP